MHMTLRRQITSLTHALVHYCCQSAFSNACTLTRYCCQSACSNSRAVFPPLHAGSRRRRRDANGAQVSSLRVPPRLRHLQRLDVGAISPHVAPQLDVPFKPLPRNNTRRRRDAVNLCVATKSLISSYWLFSFRGSVSSHSSFRSHDSLALHGSSLIGDMRLGLFFCISFDQYMGSLSRT